MKVQQLLEAEKKDVTPFTKIRRIAKAITEASKKFNLVIDFKDLGFTNRKNERVLKVEMRIHESGPLDFSTLIDPNDPNAEAIKQRMQKKLGKLPNPKEFILEKAEELVAKVRELMPEMTGLAVQPITHAAKFIPCTFEEFGEQLSHNTYESSYLGHHTTATFQMIFPLTGKGSFTLSLEMQRYKRMLGRISNKLGLHYSSQLDWKAWRFMDATVGRDLIIHPYQHLAEYHFDKKTNKTWTTPGTWDFSNNALQLKELKQLLKEAEPKLQELAATTPVHVSWRIDKIPMIDKFERTPFGLWLGHNLSNKDEYLKKVKVLIVSFGDFKS